MGRLTNNIDYCSMHCDFGKRGECFFKDKSKCYEKSMHNKLKSYEDIIDDPEKLKEFDAVYLDRCKEINRLRAELAEIRNKTIEEFAEKFIYKSICEGCSGCCNCYEKGIQSECEEWNALMKIAEKMKEVQDVN